MSSQNKKHLGYEVLALALFLGGAFFAVSAVMSMRANGGIPQNPTTELVTALLGMLGLIPFLGASIGTAALGALMFLRPAPTALRQPVGLGVSYTLAASILLGVVGSGYGGSIGAWLPGAVGGIMGVLLGVVLSFAVALLGTWLSLGMPALPKRRTAGELNSVAAALKEDETDGVSNAEAAALFPDAQAAPSVAPGVLEYEQRVRGELPEGVKPLGEEVAVETPPAAVEPEPTPLVEATMAEVETLAPEQVDDVEPSSELADGVWIRDEEPAPLETAPLTPSWEAAAMEDETLEPTDAIAEDGERFDEFEVEVALDPVEEAAAEVPEFLSEEVEEEDLEPDLDEDEVEEVAAELDEEVEEEDLEPDFDEDEVEEVAVELDELPSNTDEDAVLRALGGVFEGDVAEVAEELAELAEAEAADEASGTVEQPGLFDRQEALVLEDDSSAAREARPVEEAELPPSEGGSAEAARADDHAEAPELVEAEQALAEEEDEEPDLVEVELVPAARKEEESAEEPAAEVAEEETVELTREELIFRAGSLFIEEGRVAVSMLQRRFDLSFSEATSVLDELQSLGLIGPYAGGSRRDILMDSEAWEQCASAR